MSSSTDSQEIYLISYGTSGTLGCFMVSEQGVQYPRGAQVMVRTERGRETGTVLYFGALKSVPNGLQLSPGQILGPCQQPEDLEQGRLKVLGQSVYLTANQLFKERFYPIKLIDVEVISDPETAFLHVLRFGQIELNEVQAELAKQYQVQVMIHDVTSPEALEEADVPGCESCGSGRCGGGRCDSGGCSQCCSTVSPLEFQNDWQKYFAELRKAIERRHE